MPQSQDAVRGGGALLTLQEAADRLKVHYMTAYRWVRKGELSAIKTGGRLRVRVDDLETFVRERQVDVALPASAPRHTDWGIHVERLHRLLVAGRAVEASSLVRKVMADGAPAGEVYIHLLTPALHRVGDDWAAGLINVAVEHRASAIAGALIARLSEHFRRRGPRRGTAVTTTPPGERHALGCAMAADFLRASGYEVHHLGADVPVEDLRLFLTVVPTDVLCLSVTTRPDVRTLDAIVRAARQANGALVVLGGQGTDAPTAQAVRARHVPDLAELPAALDGPRPR